MRVTRDRPDPRWPLSLAVVALTAGAVRAADPPGQPAADPQVPQLLERLLEGVLQAVPEGIDPTAPRRREIAQQAAQLEQMFRPLMHLELALARQSCPELAPEARRAVVAAGQRAVKDVAVTAATAMFAGRPQRSGQAARRAIHDAVATALKEAAGPEEFVRYQREAELRRARREEAARLRIVLKLDEELDLTADQREAVLAALRSGWRDGWMATLDEHDGMNINGRRIAPDFAVACIEPHLTDEQKREWSAWCRVAGQRLLGVTGSFPGNVQGPPQPDAWWTQ